MQTNEVSFSKTNEAGFCKKMLIALAACSLCACVTINIYFPAAAAEKAADKIIGEVWPDKPVIKEAK